MDNSWVPNANLLKFVGAMAPMTPMLTHKGQNSVATNCYSIKWKNPFHFISYSCLWAYELAQARETKIRLHHWAWADFVMKVRECNKLRHMLIQIKTKTRRCITNTLRVTKPPHKMFRKSKKSKQP